MKIERRSAFSRAALMIAFMLIITIASSRLRADSGSCGGVTVTLPFTDVLSSNIFFCSIAEAFFSGLTNGTTPTTYNPSDPVPREQMAAFVTRTMDQSLRRGSRRAALKQFWAPTSADGLGLTTVPFDPNLVESDGADLWVSSAFSGTVSRVRASDGKLLGTWTGATNAIGVLTAKGLIFITGFNDPGTLYRIDPTQPTGPVTTLTGALGANTQGIAFDGARIWTANEGGSISIVTLNPLTVTNITVEFTQPQRILYDGVNMWVTDRGTTPGKLFKLDSNGSIVQTATTGDNPQAPVFDGTNIWVPNNASGTVTVVRASTGEVLATLTGNGLAGPFFAAFDGERIMIPNNLTNSLSLWKASDLSPLGTVEIGSSPFGVCSDGLNFWFTLFPDHLARF